MGSTSTMLRASRLVLRACVFLFIVKLVECQDSVCRDGRPNWCEKAVNLKFFHDKLVKFCKIEGSKISTKFCCKTCQRLNQECSKGSYYHKITKCTKIPKINPDINFKDSLRRNRFLIAAFNNEIEVLRYLDSLESNLKHGRDDERNTALTLASRYASKETVQILVEEMNFNVSEVGAIDRNSLLSAARGGKDDTVRYLLSVDPSLKNTRDYEESTVLTLASEYANKSTVQFLINDFGIDPSALGFVGRNSFLSAAVGSKIETLRYLNDKYPSLKNARDDESDTALTLASEIANIATVQFLIEEVGLDPSELGMDGRNSFLCAAKGGKLETLRYLNGIDPSLKNERDGWEDSALSLASDTEVISYLKNELGFKY